MIRHFLNFAFQDVLSIISTSIFVLIMRIPKCLLNFDLPQEITGIDLVQTQFKIAGW